MANDTGDRQSDGAAGAGGDAGSEELAAKAIEDQAAGALRQANEELLGKDAVDRARDVQQQEADRAMLGSRPRREADLFDAIAANLLNQTQMITAPGTVDPRWPAIIAQAFREGLGKIVSRHRGGVLFRARPDGLMDIIALDGEIED